MEQQRQPKIGNKVFNIIDLTKAITKGKTAKKKETVIKGKYKHSKAKEDNYILPTITDRQILSVQNGSIKDFISSCHPDIQHYITVNEAKQFTAKAGGMLIVCKNNIRVSINNEGYNGRRVIITDRKNILFNDITKVILEKGGS